MSSTSAPAEKNKNEFELFDPSRGREKVGEGKRFMQFGVVAGLCGLGYMVKNFKNKGDLKLSLYVIHTRMVAQMTVVGVLSLGMCAQMYKKLSKKHEEQPAVNPQD